VEIKGVQELGTMPKVIEIEVERQVGLLQLKEKLAKKNPEQMECAPPRVIDATALFEDAENRILKSGMNEGKRVFAVKFSGLAGLMNEELCNDPKIRFGKEVSAYVSGKTGCPGFFNTDEDLTGKYGFKEELLQKLKDELQGAGGNDLVCFTCWTNGMPLLAISERIASASKGVPVETRKCLPDGTTKYMRPLPGDGRFYPETDIPPIVIHPESIGTLPPVDEEVGKLRALGLNEKLALDVLLSDRRDVFDYVMQKSGNWRPSVIAGLLEETMTSLRREGVDTDSLSDEKLCRLFDFMVAGDLTREAFPDAVRTLANGKEYVPNERVNMNDVRKIVREIIESKSDFIKNEGLHALSGITGLSMERFHGTVAGREISRIVREELDAFLNQK